MNTSPGFHELQVLEIRLGLGCNDLVFSSKKWWIFLFFFVLDNSHNDIL
jgi:hypothetical protein